MSDAGTSDDLPAARLKAKKSPSAFRTISEVADELHIPQHVLRFWETKFPQVKPLKRGGGRRYYRPDDINLLRRVSDLLYIQGYTIKGVQRLLREGGGRLSDNIPPPAPGERDNGELDAQDQATDERHSGEPAVGEFDIDEVADADSAAALESEAALAMEPMLPMPGMTVPKVSGARTTARDRPDARAEFEIQRLRQLLFEVLTELESLRASLS